MTVLAYNGTELYQNDIDILVSDYLETLPDKTMIYKSTVFSGLLNYIYNHKLKNIIPNEFKNDYDLLNDIFNNIYINLCTRFNIVPSVIQFCVLCNISREVLTDIRNGTYRNGTNVNPAKSLTVRKWFDTCESMLLSKAQNESSIGSIFALKANYKYRENDSIQVIPLTDSTLSTGQILEKYGKTEKPKLTDNFED